MTDQTNHSGLLTRMQHVVRATRRRADEARTGLVGRMREGVEHTLAPAIEEAAKKLLLELAKPENAQRLQETLAGVAQSAMRTGFRADPNARLLFEFVDGLESRHGRGQVLEVVVGHAVVYEQDFLATLLEAIQDGGKPAAMHSDGFNEFRERASERLLSLLCSLAAMEGEEKPPEDARPDEQVAFFEEAPIDERFKPLARMAVGDQAAFEDAQDSPSSSKADRRPGMLRRALDRVTGDQTTALARLVPTLRDPATRFLTTSYLFFMQSYLMRAMIEELPEMLGTIRDLHREMEAESSQVIEVED